MFSGLRFALVGGDDGARAEWALILLAAGAACAEDSDVFGTGDGADSRPRAKARRRARQGQRGAGGEGPVEGGPDYVLSLAGAGADAEAAAPVLDAWPEACGVTIEWASHCLVTQARVEPTLHQAFAAGAPSKEGTRPGRSARKRPRTQAKGAAAGAARSGSSGDDAAIAVTGDARYVGPVHACARCAHHRLLRRRFRVGSVLLYRTHGRDYVGQLETVRDSKLCIRRLRVSRRGAKPAGDAATTLSQPTTRAAHDVVPHESVLSRLLCLPEAVAADMAAGYLGRDPEVCTLTEADGDQ